MTQTTAQITESFYDLALETRSVKNHTSVIPKNEDNVFNRLFPIIPKASVCEVPTSFLLIFMLIFKNFILKIEDTSVRSTRENSQTDFNSSLQILLLTYRATSSIDSKDFSNMILNFKMGDFKIQNSRDKLLVLNNLSLDAKVRKHVNNVKYALQKKMWNTQ